MTATELTRDHPTRWPGISDSVTPRPRRGTRVVRSGYQSLSVWAVKPFVTRGALIVLMPYASLLRFSDSSRAVRSHWLRPLESAQSTWAPVMPPSADEAPVTVRACVVSLAAGEELGYAPGAS